MANFGLSYDLASLKGYAALQRRLEAIKGGGRDPSFMKNLGQAANREQKKLLYTEAVTRRTGQSGRQITVEAATAVSVMTVARGTAAWADTGTKPHRIPKVGNKLLAWGGARRLSGALRSGASADHFAMHVQHPGTKPHPYMLRAAMRAVKQVGIQPIIDLWNRAA